MDNYLSSIKNFKKSFDRNIKALFFVYRHQTTDIYNEIATHHQANERILVQLLDIWLQRVARDIEEPETHDNRLLELKRHITNNLDQDLSLKSLFSVRVPANVASPSPKI